MNMAADRPDDRFVDVNGLRLHYLDWGNRESTPMILLHGFMGHARVWDHFASKVKDHFHIIALDQRGHGESDWSETASYRIDDHFSDISLFVDRLNLDNLILVGHSMGGRNALFYTASLYHSMTGCRL
ncbi:alpha/beta fold hydrolase, partial [Thermodesulfobacteriota bacterium]